MSTFCSQSVILTNFSGILESKLTSRVEVTTNIHVHNMNLTIKFVHGALNHKDQSQMKHKLQTKAIEDVYQACRP